MIGNLLFFQVSCPVPALTSLLIVRRVDNHTPDNRKAATNRAVGKNGVGQETDHGELAGERERRTTFSRQRRSGPKHGPTERLNRRGGTGPPPVPISEDTQMVTVTSDGETWLKNPGLRETLGLSKNAGGVTRALALC